jgi:hypothetical protein
MKKIFLVTLFLAAFACQKKDQAEKTTTAKATIKDEHTFLKQILPL